MRDGFDRQINYMRLSVTDRCNLRCMYCSPGSKFTSIPHEEILTFEEFLRLARLAQDIGITKFRVTGGEPLARKGLMNFLRSLIETGGARDVSLTTNGTLLLEHLEALRNAGLKRINISCDSLDPRVYSGITGGGRLERVIEAIEKAVDMNFSPVKINVVLLKGLNDDPSPFVEFARAHPVPIRFIELMDFSPAKDRFLSAREVKERLEAFYGRLEETEAPEGAGPARYFRLQGMAGRIGFISPYSEHFCAACNRLRITADGRILPCLFSERTVDVKKVLRTGARDDVIKAALREALSGKPGSREEAAGPVQNRGMRNIGG
jgi:cyclic pyranopterin phosphate synthase